MSVYEVECLRLHPDAVWRKRQEPGYRHYGEFLGVPVAVIHAMTEDGARWVQPMSFHSTIGPQARGHWERNGLPVAVLEVDLWPQTYIGGL